MSEQEGTDSVDLDRVVAAAVTRATRNGAWLSREDLAQEAWVWLLSHPGEVEADPDQPRLVAWRLIRKVGAYLGELNRREKASTEGYSPADEYFYSASKVAEYLPHVVSGSFERPAFLENTTSRRELSESPDWQAYRADVDRAWKQAPLTEQERRMLLARHVEKGTWREVGAEWGITEPWAKRKTEAAMRKLIAVIGDVRPEVEWTYLDSRLRERPAKRRW